MPYYITHGEMLWDCDGKITGWAAEMQDARNIVLIGMPGIGKSTLGIVLAKVLGKDFVDTDLLLQRAEGASLEEIISRRGVTGFLEAEEALLCGLDAHDAIISTGGSAVYSERGMRHLGEMGTIVYLHAPLSELEQRLGGLSERGVVMPGGSQTTLADLAAERTPLYERHADVSYRVRGDSLRSDVERLAELLRTHGIA
jgi:shikimate kinase